MSQKLSSLNINHLNDGDVMLFKLPPKLKEQLWKLQKDEQANCPENLDQDLEINKEKEKFKLHVGDVIVQ